MSHGRAYIILTAPLEIIGCTLIGAWRGYQQGCASVFAAWREHRMRHVQ